MSVAAGRLRWHDREDLVQDALLRVHLAIQGGKVLVDPLSYAVQATRRLLVDRARQVARQRTFASDMVSEASVDSAESTGARQVTLVAGDGGPMFRGRLQKSIMRGVCEGRLLAEVAEQLGMPRKEVQRVAARMLMRMQQLDHAARKL